jgi:DNA-binding CsgD family transcriptional regulator/tetratricopeptide (TPR) repeat protein
MPGSEASPVFVGRDAELEVLERALDVAAGGTTGTVLVGAESGVGKSRLISQFAANARDRALVLIGGCVEVGAALPYAPVTALLRMLVRSRGAGQVAALLPGNQAAELSVLLPEFGEQPSGGDPAMTRARLFEALLTLVEALGEERPLVLVIEDAHWADRSTCDLLTFLVRNVRQAPVLLIVTFRSEDTEGAPLRSLIAGLGRMEGVQRIELEPLSRRDVAAQLEGMLSGPPRPALINAVYQRGGGNPLFTEALVNRDGSLAAGLPWSLRDLILARVRELPAETQQALRMTAVGGDHVTHALLAAAAKLDDATLTSALRPAVAAHILISDADGYGFRHQLFREAVLADLLPGDRAVAHRGFATALAATPPDQRDGTAGVQLALHWRGAHENERALIAAWQAAADAGAAFGYAQRLQMLDQVRELWPSVPDAASSTGTDYVGILELAADTARWAGEPERGLALVADALAKLDEKDDPERRAVALFRRADLRRELLQPGQLDDLREALRLASEPTPVRARILAYYCWALRREDRNAAAERYVTELSALARQLGDEERQVEASMLLAAVAAHKGEDTVAALLSARDAAAKLGSGHLEVWAYLTLGHVLGDPPGDRGSNAEAIQLGRQGLARARQLGLARQIAAPIAGNLAQALTSAGRWDEALEIIDEILSLDQPPLGRAHQLLTRAQIVVARGDVDSAIGIVAEVRSLAAIHSQGHYAYPLAQLEIHWRLASGDLTGALACARALPATHQATDPAPRFQWALIGSAMRACAEAKAFGLPDADVSELRTDLEARAAALPRRRTPLQDAYAALVAAESSRAEGRQDPASWDAAHAAWERLGRPYQAAYALLHAARAAMARGDRDAAAVRLRAGAELAEQVGARPLLQQFARQARQAGVDLSLSGQAAAPTRFGLTERETEVLRLVAEGRGNRDIAAELFISPKTASVHVSNILGKLGVATRTEAAAVTYRLHLLDEQ